MEAPSHISVFVRIRPLKNEEERALELSSKSVTAIVDKKSRVQQFDHFDHVFGEHTTQNEVFEVRSTPSTDRRSRMSLFVAAA